MENFEEVLPEALVTDVLVSFLSIALTTGHQRNFKNRLKTKLERKKNSMRHLLANLTAEETLLEATVQYIHIVENFEEVLPED